MFLDNTVVQHQVPSWFEKSNRLFLSVVRKITAFQIIFDLKSYLIWKAVVFWKQETFYGFTGWKELHLQSSFSSQSLPPASHDPPCAAETRGKVAAPHRFICNNYTNPGCATNDIIRLLRRMHRKQIVCLHVCYLHCISSLFHDRCKPFTYYPCQPPTMSAGTWSYTLFFLIRMTSSSLLRHQARFPADIIRHINR